LPIRTEERSSRGIALFLATSCWLASGCGGGGGSPAKSAPPAKVQNAQKEVDLATVTLTEQAEARLGIETVDVERRSVSRTRSVGGEIIVPPGRSIVISAPVAGLVLAPSGSLPQAGALVQGGQVLVSLVPMPSAAELTAAAVKVAAARQRALRAEQLLKIGAGSQRASEEAAAELEVAEANARAARPSGDAKAKAGALSVESPQAGVIRAVYVGAGQSVASGAPIMQIDGLDPLWIRVPVYAGDLADVEPGKPARLRKLAARPTDRGREVGPVAAPPSANPDAASSDLHFALANASGEFRPGERVEVSLALRGAEEALVVPWSAILHDIHGGAWLYERVAPHVFSRRRVEVLRVAGEVAVLARGPAPGAKVVAVGAAELFSTEFGTGK
jgi:cobalt-zinc-cadmium efflux system membrane fusion protein